MRKRCSSSNVALGDYQYSTEYSVFIFSQQIYFVVIFSQQMDSNDAPHDFFYT